jgi:outer membrane protein assembly factor BamD
MMAFLTAGCGGYNKILKSSDNELKYKAALKYFNKGDFARSTPLFEALGMPFEGTQRQDTVNYYEAKGYYMLHDYEVADSYLANFCRVFGRSKFAEEAYYLRAKNLYRMSFRSELDQANTVKAIAAFSEFHSKYPESELGKNDKNHFTELQNRLDHKAFMSAKLYYQIDDYKAAIVALRNSVKDYPNSQYKEEQMFLILKSSYVYAKKSVKKRQAERYIAAIDEYYNFMSEFPESKYSKEAENMYQEALSFTKKRGLSLEAETPQDVNK